MPSAHKCPSRARERRCEAQVLCLACCDRHLACTSSSPQVYMCRVVASMVVNAGDWRVSAEGMCTCTPRRPTPLLQQRPTNGFAAMSVAASAEMSAMGLRVVLVAWVWRRLRNGPIAACLEGMLSSGLLIPGQSTTLVQKAGRWIKTLAARRITKSKPSFAGGQMFRSSDRQTGMPWQTNHRQSRTYQIRSERCISEIQIRSYQRDFRQRYSLAVVVVCLVYLYEDSISAAKTCAPRDGLPRYQ